MDESMLNFIKGDIVWGEKNKNKGGKHAHYIIYLDEHSTDVNLFVGAMLTHSTSYGNIKLLPEHFKEKDSNGDDFKFKYENSYIVNKCCLKKLSGHRL
jgi:hypothetical protein